MIKAAGNSQKNGYIQSAQLNGKSQSKNYIRYSDVANGGVLQLVIGGQSTLQRGTLPADKPFSLSKQ